MRQRHASRAFAAVVALVALVAFASLGGCDGGRALVASSADHEAYRGVRMAAHEGTRLARARDYLQRHPKGTYAAEVKAIYDAEEPAYFERAKQSPSGARDYLASLPGGPHAAAASAVLRADYERAEDIALARELGDGRAAEARFQRALAARRAASVAVLDAVGALLDPALLGARRAAPPLSLVTAVYGDRPSLSGLPAEADRDLFFTLPGRIERPDRVLTLHFSLTEGDGRITAAAVSGEDLFVHWREADVAEALDPTLPPDRARGLAHAGPRLAGALEARFPEARCAVVLPGEARDARDGGAPARPDEVRVLTRACDGVRVVITQGARAGVPDRIQVWRVEGR